MENMKVNEKEYSVLELLGHGKGGYSYLVSDGAEQYVLKQIHHEPCDYYQFGDKLQAELRDYQRLKDIDLPVPELLAVDVGRERILKTYIPGPTIATLVETGALEADYWVQVRQMAEKARRAGLNIDYYPTNFIPFASKLYYIDYECNAYDPKWNFENWGKQYWGEEPQA